MQQLTRLTLAIAASAVLASLIPAPAAGQGMLDRLKKKAEEAAKGKVEDRTEKKAGDATDAALDKAECAVPGKKCDESKKGTAPVAGKSAAAKSATQRPGEGAWKNYDFVPGDRVIFAEDFSSATVGDFPRRLTFVRGNFEVVEWTGSRFLSSNTFDSRFAIPLPEVLPERFTLEFDYSAAGGNGAQIYFADPQKGGESSHVDVGTWFGGVAGSSSASGKPQGNEFKYKDVVFPVKVMADGDYVKVYMGDTRVANVPNAKLGRAKAIWFTVPGREDRAAMIGNVRVAAGGRKLYEAIAESGRVATQGIYFDIGSDRLRPESSPTLKEIGAMLAEHPELTLTIEGHTDNVGAAATNMTLSQQRATAVKAALVSSYGADAGRLTAKGLGASKPAAPNTTAEGREQNRRVELVRNTP
jgi:OOP family OmpA-OmpF porin